MLVLVFIWAIGANWLATRKGFYTILKQKGREASTLTLIQLLSAFGIYLFLSLIFTPLLVFFLSKMVPVGATTLPLPVATGIQFGIMCLIFSSLFAYLYHQDRCLCLKIWKNREHVPYKPTLYDFGLGLFTWFLSFPLVSILGDFIDKLLKALFHYTHIDQNAVKFVKIALSSPLSFIFALLSVLVLAPLIEEFLFRGILQTYLKKKVGRGAAILLSALAFAFFHFSIGQGIENISLILSLLVLGCYLGFLYEKQGSLWAPIGLHFVFNLVSALRIIFFPESP